MFLQHASISLYFALSTNTFTDIRHKMYCGPAVSSQLNISLFSKNLQSIMNIFEILDPH